MDAAKNVCGFWSVKEREREREGARKNKINPSFVLGRTACV